MIISVLWNSWYASERHQPIGVNILGVIVLNSTPCLCVVVCSNTTPFHKMVVPNELSNSLCFAWGLLLNATVVACVHIYTHTQLGARELLPVQRC